jgi:hypothetical protein
MRNLSVILVALVVQVAYGHYQGPFLLWGVENLSDLKIPALKGEDFKEFKEFFNVLEDLSRILTFLKQYYSYRRPEPPRNLHKSHSNRDFYQKFNNQVKLREFPRIIRHNRQE